MFSPKATFSPTFLLVCEKNTKIANQSPNRMSSLHSFFLQVKQLRFFVLKPPNINRYNTPLARCGACSLSKFNKAKHFCCKS
jgi:hypothetical protein